MELIAFGLIGLGVLMMLVGVSRRTSPARVRARERASARRRPHSGERR